MAAGSLQLLYSRYLRRELAEICQGGCAYPGLRGASARAVLDKAHGYVELLLNPPGEVVGHRGEPTVVPLGDRGRSAHFPGPDGDRRRRIGHPRTNQVQAQVRMVCCLDHLGPVVRGPDAQVHVRLPAAEPHVANEDILQGDVPLAVYPYGVGPSHGRYLE